jgi:hypothetical protein
VTIGASSGDCEIAWENRPWEANHNFVAYFKVAGATNDSADIGAAIGCELTLGSNSNLAPTNGLAIGLFFWGELKNLTNHNRAGEVESVRTLFFEAHLNELGHYGIWGGVCRQVYVFSKP